MIVLNIISYILAIVGLFELSVRIKNFIQENVWLSLKNPKGVLDWQSQQIAKASFLAAKKLHILSKKIKDKALKEKAIGITTRVLEIRKRMYANLKNSGYNTTEFKALANESNKLYNEYITFFNNYISKDTT